MPTIFSKRWKVSQPPTGIGPIRTDGFLPASFIPRRRSVSFTTTFSPAISSSHWKFHRPDQTSVYTPKNLRVLLFLLSGNSRSKLSAHVRATVIRVGYRDGAKGASAGLIRATMGSRQE